ncbi:MAG: hypothetical protein ACRCYP_03620 [Alphaproteobacteria bacterium]
MIIQDKTTGALTRRPPSLGKLKKGAPKGQLKDLDHWRFAPDDRYPFLDRIFKEFYGEEPREVNIWLLGHTIEDNFDDWYEQWADGQRLVYRCNGQEIVQSYGEEDLAYNFNRMPCRRNAESPCECKAVGRLSFAIKEFFLAGYTSTVTLEIKSPNDLNAVRGALDNIEALVRAAGLNSMRGVQLVLRRVKDEISVPAFAKQNGKFERLPGKRKMETKWMVGLDFAPEYHAELMRSIYSSDRTLSSGAQFFLTRKDMELLPAPEMKQLPHHSAPALPASESEEAVEVEVVDEGGAVDPKEFMREVVKQLKLKPADVSAWVTKHYPGGVTVENVEEACDRLKQDFAPEPTMPPGLE